MSATPYELRAQLLRQAEGILMHKYQTQYDRIRENIQLKQGNGELINIDNVDYPNFPTTEDIIDEAEKLYRFVQTK